MPNSNYNYETTAPVPGVDGNGIVTSHGGKRTKFSDINCGAVGVVLALCIVISLVASGAGISGSTDDAATATPHDGCTTDDVVYFNSKVAEFLDLLGLASESVSLLAAADGLAAALGAYAGGIRSDAESDFVAFVEEFASRGLVFSFAKYRKDRDTNEPQLALSYSDRESFLSGIFDGEGSLVAPGFYAALALTTGRYLNPNGGDTGYTRCRPGEGTATTRVRTIDTFVAADPRTDLNGDGRFENEVVEARLVFEWERNGKGHWSMSQVTLTANYLGYLTYNYTDVVEVGTPDVDTTPDGDAATPTPDVDATPEVDATHWPPVLFNMFSTISFPVTTAQATEKGWIKSDEPCNPPIGEAWLLSGERALNSSATLYFTPEVEGTPGYISGIEVDYYGYIEENLVGTYFSEAKTAKDGTYHSVAVALRDQEKYDLCDTKKPIAGGNDVYIAIAPAMARTAIPASEDSPGLSSNWREGSCLRLMGRHWFQDVETGKDLTLKTENTVPVVPMYNDTDGSINGIFFLATGRKQFWDDECDLLTMGMGALQCNGPNMNFWDPSPGLDKIRRFPGWPFYMCANMCGECQFTGTEDGGFATMHWYFKDAKDVTCKTQCRNGEAH